MSNTNTMNATDKQFAQIKTGPETALYLRRYNAHRAKKAAGIRTRPPINTSCIVEIREMNPAAEHETRWNFLNSLETEIDRNHQK